MNLNEFLQIIDKSDGNKYFLPINFGCRVNSAEINQLSQILVNQGYKPSSKKDDYIPEIVIINTCSITKKGEYESLSEVRKNRARYPSSKILVTGCANLSKVNLDKDTFIFNNQSKEDILNNLKCAYTSNISDKFSQSHKFLLKVQSGCKQFCSYCTVPFQRRYNFSLSIPSALKTVNEAVLDNYKELIITGVNLDEYKPGFSNLLKAILENTNIPKVSFGSIPINSIDDTFIDLYRNPEHQKRLPKMLHIPIQSGSNRILKLMNRPYTKKDVLQVFQNLKEVSPDLNFGTDIIVGFPTESEKDFLETYNLCKSLKLKKIHTFKYSPRPNTLANLYFEKNPKINKDILKERSQKIRSISQTTPPSHQKLSS